MGYKDSIFEVPYSSTEVPVGPDASIKWRRTNPEIMKGGFFSRNGELQWFIASTVWGLWLRGPGGGNGPGSERIVIDDITYYYYEIKSNAKTRPKQLYDYGVAHVTPIVLDDLTNYEFRKQAIDMFFNSGDLIPVIWDSSKAKRLNSFLVHINQK